ncbi:Zinc finger protein [Plakobranchus ocellatus]|uniref:Zinc finger protein n=1 Tax=Plakobranchus ocellatus TaxID=259542 RepID=A0AAV3YZ28_9GAST|nr:Zinc finger protein [Plakobranchus ocellatus]
MGNLGNIRKSNYPYASSVVVVKKRMALIVSVLTTGDRPEQEIQAEKHPAEDGVCDHGLLPRILEDVIRDDELGSNPDPPPAVKMLVRGMDYVVDYKDDLLVHTPTWVKTLRELFRQLQTANVIVRPKKCVLEANTIDRHPSSSAWRGS